MDAIAGIRDNALSRSLIITVPAHGWRVGVRTPMEAYEAVADLLEDGYKPDEIEWEMS